MTAAPLKSRFYLSRPSGLSSSGPENLSGPLRRLWRRAGRVFLAQSSPRTFGSPAPSMSAPQAPLAPPPPPIPPSIPPALPAALAPASAQTPSHSAVPPLLAAFRLTFDPNSFDAKGFDAKGFDAKRFATCLGAGVRARKFAVLLRKCSGFVVEVRTVCVPCDAFIVEARGLGGGGPVLVSKVFSVD